jgi:hypothetical protein
VSYDSGSGSVTAAQIATGNPIPVNVRPALGNARRRLSIGNGTNVTVTVLVRQNGQVATPAILQFTITAGANAIVGNGVGAGDGGTYTRTAGNEALLDAPCASLTVQVLQNAGATTGSLTAELEQQG